jgi:hypothetical protein
MIKVVIYTLALSMLCAGSWELVSSWQYSNKANNWKPIEGWLTGIGDGEFDFQLPSKKLKNINFFVSQPHASFVYFVDGLMYYQSQTLPPTLGIVRSSIVDSKLLAGVTGDTKSVEESFAEDMESADDRPLARYNQDTKKLEVRTEDGMTISSNYGTSHLGEKWEELPRERWDDFMPRVKIKYNPEIPQDSVTDPDLLDGAETLKWTGIWCLIGGILMIAGMRFHEWVTKPAPEPDPFRSGPGRRF